MMKITSVNNELIKETAKLLQKKYRKGLFLLEGEKCIEEAVNSGVEIVNLFVIEGFSAFRQFSNRIETTAAVLSKISSTDTPPKAVAVAKKIERKWSDKYRKVILLENIKDAGNLGTILRSASAFNIDAVVLYGETVDLYNPKTLRATQGMLFHLNVISRKIDDILDVLKNRNVPIYGSSVDYGMDVCDLNKKDKESFALIVGNEGNGIRSTTFEKCDKRLYVKMNERVESLNVAVATSILLYELNK